MKTWTIVITLATCLISSPASAACSVYITTTRSTADYMVYFTTTRSNQRNQQLVEDCKITKTRSTATVKVYITDTRSNADIIVLRKNFAKRN